MLSQCSNSIGLSPTSPSGGRTSATISPSAFAFAMEHDKVGQFLIKKIFL